MGKIKDNLIWLLGGVPFEDYSKSLKEYKEFCNKLLKKWEKQQVHYISSTKESIGLKASRVIDKDYYNEEAAKEDILKELMKQIDKNHLITFCTTTGAEDNMVRIDAYMRVIEP